MHNGRVVERGRTETILDDPQDPYTRLLRASVPRKGWKPMRRRRAAATQGDSA
jgi:oligopeptide transport system ATP-binding protein